MMMMMMALSQSTNSTNGSRANNNNNSNLDASSSSSTMGQSSKGTTIQEYLTNCKSLYSCIYCRTHLANHDELVSRSFQGNHGRAYLFNSVVNIGCGPAVQRDLNTGPHAVADIYCSNCHTTLGWKYEKAYVETQKYKEGKYIIELAHVVRENRHLEFDKGEMLLERSRRRSCQNRGHMSSSRLWQGSTSNDRSLLQCGSGSSNNNNYNDTHPSSLATRTTSSLATIGGSPNGGQAASPDGGSGENRYNYNHVLDYDNDNDNDDDDDEELMFPFYDDMRSNRSSYPCSLSSSQHNRMRRSLYLDSTPFDWKYATSAFSGTNGNSNAEASASSSSSGYTSSEFDQSKGQAPKFKSTTAAAKAVATTKEYSASSLEDSGLSDLSPPSTSFLSSDASPPEQNQMSYHDDNINMKSNLINNSDKHKARGNGSNSGRCSSSSSSSGGRSRDNSEHREQETYNNDDMQFKFEADRPELQVNNNNNNRNRSTQQQINKHCDQPHSRTEIVECGTEHLLVGVDPQAIESNSSSSSNKNNNINDLSENGHEGPQNQKPSSSKPPPPPPRVSTTYSRQSSMDEAGISTSLEDEEFYDCYTDHEVSNMMAEPSGSTSTLKIIE